MKLRLVLPLMGLAAAAACSGPQTDQADPAAVEQLLVRLEARQSAASQAPGGASDKLHRAERLIAPLEKVQVDKIDPQIALSVIAG